MWSPRGGGTAPVQGGQAVAAPPGQPNPVPAVQVPSALSVLNTNPLTAALRENTSSLDAPLDTEAFTYSTTDTYTQDLKNAALAYGVDAWITGTTSVSVAASSTSGQNGGGIALSPKFPWNLLQNVQFGINQIADVINASGWMLFQENLAMLLPGLDPRQQKAQFPTTPGPGGGPATMYTLPYYVSAKVHGGSGITLDVGGSTYYNTTTAAQQIDITWAFPLLVPFVNNFDEFLGIVPSAAQDVELSLQYKLASPLGSDLRSPIVTISGADITGSTTLVSHTGSIYGTELFLSSPPAGMEAVYAVQAGTICQRFEQSVAVTSTGQSGAKYVAPQGAYLLRMIGDLTVNMQQDTADVSQMRLVLNEFGRPITLNLQNYLQRFYRKYGRLPDPGIFLWDGSYSSIVPNWGDSMDWVNAGQTVKPTWELDIATSATLGGAGKDTFNVFRTQLVTP